MQPPPVTPVPVTPVPSAQVTTAPAPSNPVPAAPAFSPPAAGPLAPVPVPSTTPDFPTWFDYAVAIGTALGSVAALAAAVAAVAAVVQARRSTAAARDALEALGRALRPDDIGISAVHRAGRDAQDLTVADAWPGPLTITLISRSQYTATAVRVTLTDASGKRWPTTEPVTLGPRGLAEVHIDGFEATTLEATDPIPADVVSPRAQHRVEIEYGDERFLLRWRRTGVLDEMAVLRTDRQPHVPQWVFLPAMSAHPELIDRPR